MNVKPDSYLKEYASKLDAEVNSSLNEWGAGMVVGHPPTWAEKFTHFVVSGALTRFHKRFVSEHPRLFSVAG